jgi:hypothetical protein
MELGRTTRNRWLHLGRIGLDERERKAADLRSAREKAEKAIKLFQNQICLRTDIVSEGC